MQLCYGRQKEVRHITLKFAECSQIRVGRETNSCIEKSFAPTDNLNYIRGVVNDYEKKTTAKGDLPLFFGFVLGTDRSRFFRFKSKGIKGKIIN